MEWLFIIQKWQINNQYKIIEEAVAISSGKADRFYQNGDIESSKLEQLKVEDLYKQYENNETAIYAVNDIFSNSKKAFTKYNKVQEEENAFNLKVENGEVVANVSNYLGQIPLGIASSVTSLITGVARIGSTVKILKMQ